MNLNTYEEKAKEFVYKNTYNHRLIEQSLGLAGEVSQVIQVVKKNTST